MKALNPWTVVEALGLLNGVGPAMASVILTFYAPRTFRVYDQHMWNTLRTENKVSGDIEGSTEQYIDALEVLRRIAAQYSLSVREVEIAYFSKDYYSDEE